MTTTQRILSIAALVILFILGAWGIIVIASRIPAALSYIGSAVSAPFSSQFAHNRNTMTGSPALSVPATSTIATTTISIATTTVEPYVPPVLPQVPATTTTVVMPPAATTTQVTHPATPSTPHVTVPNVVDLSVRIVSAGAGYARFSIMNAGGHSTPAGWTFTATLPTTQPYTYTSPAQPALGYNQGYVYTLQWPTAYQATGGVFTLVADPSNITGDVNPVNNTASAHY